MALYNNIAQSLNSRQQVGDGLSAVGDALRPRREERRMQPAALPQFSGPMPQDLMPPQPAEQPKRVADLAGIGPDDFSSSQEKGIQDAAFSYRTLMKNMDAYKSDLQSGDVPIFPDERKDRLSTAHRNLQMQMKELFNLGVLNGPDLDLMNQILIDPAKVSSHVVEFFGGPVVEERLLGNLDHVRGMMTNLVEPKLTAANIDIDQLVPKRQVSDEDFLKQLGLE